jgi:hypothetical protein
MAHRPACFPSGGGCPICEDDGQLWPCASALAEEKAMGAKIDRMETKLRTDSQRQADKNRAIRIRNAVDEFLAAVDDARDAGLLITWREIVEDDGGKTIDVGIERHHPIEAF